MISALLAVSFLNPALMNILTFGAGVMVVIAVYSLVSDLFLRDRDRLRQRLDDEFRVQQREEIQRSAVFKNLGQLAAEAALDEEESPGLRARFQTMVEQSGVRTTARRLLLIIVVAAIALGVATGAARRSPVVGAVGAVIGGSIPLLYVAYRRKTRLQKLMSQLPDAFDLMSRIIRAGQTIAQAIQGVAEEFDQPIAGEFNYCYEQQNLGLSPEVSLRELARRTGLLEVKIFVLALLIQQQSGGNLAEMLDKLAAIIRERFRIQGKIRALTAEGRMQAIVILCIPVVMMGIMVAMSQQYADAIAKHPNMIIGAFGCEAIGALWVRKIVNFDF